MALQWALFAADLVTCRWLFFVFSWGLFFCDCSLVWFRCRGCSRQRSNFLLRQKVTKNRFLIPTAELSPRLRRSGQTAAVSQSFCGGRHFALLVPLTSFLVRSWFFCPLLILGFYCSLNRFLLAKSTKALTLGESWRLEGHRVLNWPVWVRWFSSTRVSSPLFRASLAKKSGM